MRQIQLLKNADLLAGLTDDVLEEVAASMERIPFRTGETVFNKGEQGDAVYLVEEGQLRLESDGVPFFVCDPGEWVGELALIVAVEFVTAEGIARFALRSPISCCRWRKAWLPRSSSVRRRS